MCKKVKEMCIITLSINYLSAHLLFANRNTFNDTTRLKLLYIVNIAKRWYFEHYNDNLMTQDDHELYWRLFCGYWK